MKLTRREWGLGAVAALAQGACSSAQNPPEEAADTETTTPPGSLLEHSIVLDLHCDTPMLITDEGFNLGERHDYGQVDIPRLREGGVTGVFFSIYTSATAQPPPESVKRALAMIETVQKEVARHPDDLVLAVSADDIVRAKQDGKIAILMGVEGGHMIDSSLDHLRHFYELGARYLTLTHTADTPWAGSSGAKSSGKGLTDFGRDVVREMNRLGMMVDISHVSDRTFFDVLETSSAPIIASHSSCRALADHPRNMTDSMLLMLSKKGGVAHINYYSSFLDDEYRQKSGAMDDVDALADAVRKKYANDSKQRSIELRKIDQQRIGRAGRIPLSRLLDHIEHAVKITGADHVGLGSDFDGVNDQTPAGMEDISKIPNLVAGLRERKFSGADIQKILGGNTLRVMQEVEAAAAGVSPAQTDPRP
jgi:membrane dipeptidase